MYKIAETLKHLQRRQYSVFSLFKQTTKTTTRPPTLNLEPSVTTKTTTRFFHLPSVTTKQQHDSSTFLLLFPTTHPCVFLHHYPGLWCRSHVCLSVFFLIETKPSKT